jgi:hypothetical protein
VSENEVLRLFGPIRKKQEDGENCIIYSSSNTVRVTKSRWMRCGEQTAQMGQMRNACKILTGNPQEKRPLGIATHGWDITMDLREIGKA